MVGFFLPGDSLLFVAGIYSQNLIDSLITGGSGSDFFNLVVLWILVSACGIMGNMVGYWFGKKSGHYLFQRKDNFFFKQKHLLDAKAFYEKHGGQAIVLPCSFPLSAFVGSLRE
jgi:membrane-associated protein